MSGHFKQCNRKHPNGEPCNDYVYIDELEAELSRLKSELAHANLDYEKLTDTLEAVESYRDRALAQVEEMRKAIVGVFNCESNSCACGACRKNLSEALSSTPASPPASEDKLGAEREDEFKECGCPAHRDLMGNITENPNFDQKKYEALHPDTTEGGGQGELR